MGNFWVVWLVCARFDGGLARLWVVCGWFGWFVGGLDGLWVVLSFTANEKR